jgi:hypothetical protein
VGVVNRYVWWDAALIVIILPFAFAYFFEMQKELMKIQGSKSMLMQWRGGITSCDWLVLYRHILLCFAVWSMNTLRVSNW